MTGHEFIFHGTTLSALPSGALWDASARLLCVSDLHLGKSDRIVRRSGRMLPPYETLAQMQAGRDWVWIEGNHDPGPVNIGGRHLVSMTVGQITYRHIAEIGKSAEISGHYHPKCTVGRSTKPCFLIDTDKIIMPAFGAYTGGLRSGSDVLRRLMAPDAIAVLTGRKALPVPFSAVT